MTLSTLYPRNSNPNPSPNPNPDQVLYAQWLQLSGVLKEDGSFDDAAYRAKVAMATREKKEAERLKGMSAAEKAAAEKAAEKARAAEEAKAAKAAAAAEADLRRPARQAQVLAEWKASAGIASYYDAGVRLSSKTGKSGLGLGLTPCQPNLT